MNYSGAMKQYSIAILVYGDGNSGRKTRNINNKNSFRPGELERLCITLVLPIVGLDIGTISSGNSAVLRFGA